MLLTQTLKREISMRRTIGLLFVIHGLTHAGAGMWLKTAAPLGLVIALWWLAMSGFIVAGAGLMGVQWLDRRWRVPSCIAALASLVLLAMSWSPLLMVGAAIDGAILLDAIPFVHYEVARQLGVPEHPAPRRTGPIGAVVAGVLVICATTFVTLHPWLAR